ncbi:hypothetical protein R1sor_011989 [Riccia sorocarpa]|uniref:Uncharacterized protein n=1 Tax=Riccia sorocarpa TaxID=122646 RepID=A0ABD3I2W6_9MARC
MRLQQCPEGYSRTFFLTIQNTPMEARRWGEDPQQEDETNRERLMSWLEEVVVQLRDQVSALREDNDKMMNLAKIKRDLERKLLRASREIGKPSVLSEVLHEGVDLVMSLSDDEVEDETFCVDSATPSDDKETSSFARLDDGWKYRLVIVPVRFCVYQ